MKILDEVYYDLFRRVLAGLCLPTAANEPCAWKVDPTVKDAVAITDAAIKQLKDAGVIGDGENPCGLEPPE